MSLNHVTQPGRVTKCNRRKLLYSERQLKDPVVFGIFDYRQEVTTTTTLLLGRGQATQRYNPVNAMRGSQGDTDLTAVLKVFSTVTR